jgi:hypothetical protein
MRADFQPARAQPLTSYAAGPAFGPLSGAARALAWARGFLLSRSVPGEVSRCWSFRVCALYVRATITSCGRFCGCVPRIQVKGGTRWLAAL